MFSRKIFHKFVVLLSLLLSVLILMGQGCSPGLRPFSNKSLSSLSSTTMSGNFDTDYKTGVQLYNTNCMQCHGTVEATNKPKASVPTISAAINNISMMTQLKFLTNTQIQLISLALSGQAPSTAGGGGASTPPVVVQPPIEPMPMQTRFEVAKTILQANCASCHYQGAAAGQIIFNTEKEFISGGLITPASISGSLLARRLKNYTGVNATAANMPPTSKLSDADYAKITSWIENIPLESVPTVNGKREIFSCDQNESPDKLNIARLNRDEIYNTLNGLLSRAFGATESTQILNTELAAYVAGIPSDAKNPYIRADKSLNSSHVNAYFDLADQIAQNIVSNSSRYQRFVTTFVNYNATGCTGLNVNSLSTGCRDALIKNFALRAWGRPVESTDVNLNNEFASLVKTFNSTTATTDVGNFIFRVLVSPSFLNHAYIDLRSLNGQVGDLTSFAIARRLSFHFMRSQLDEQMISIATNNDLGTEAGFSVAINYLMPKASPMVKEFATDWLSLDRIPEVNSKASAKYTAITQGLTVDNNFVSAAKQEAVELVEYIFQNDRPVKELLTSDVSLARNANLMKVYGVTAAAPSAVTEVNAIRFSKDHGRSGLPSRAAFLFSGTDTERPIIRAVRVNKIFMCKETKGQPPANAAATVFPTGNLTTRQSVTAGTSSSSCVGCHSIINPTGFAFGNFNALGSYQKLESLYTNNTLVATLPIDSSVDLLNIFNISVITKDAAEFNKEIAESDGFRGCLPQNYFTFLNRLPDKTESLSSCQMNAMEKVISNGGTLKDFMKASVQDIRFKKRLLVK